ncbi:uncharacterized protein LOC119179667 isoform X3 [Rhipicephalus microplus]|uniref:uncharacterized protein LOC119179667 isoform X3 n=1 Tax=Rhipicephalus microplus TaxID=6941 RepID=UPI003F6C96C9
MQRTRPICQRYFRRVAYNRALRRVSAGMATAEQAQSRRFKSMATQTDDTAQCYTDGSARGCTFPVSDIRWLGIDPGFRLAFTDAIEDKVAATQPILWVIQPFLNAGDAI